MNEELKVIISAEISKFKKNVKDAKADIKGFAEQVKKSKEDADKHLKAIGTSIGNGLKTAAGIGVAAIAGVATALVGASEATAEYRENQSKLLSTFETAGGSAKVAKDTYNDLYRVLGDDGQTTEAAAHLAQLTTNQKALSEWTTACKGIYATFGDSLPIEGLTEAANETAKVGTVTGGLADALNWAKVSNEDMGKTLSFNKEAQDAFNKAIKEGETREDAFNAALAACNTEAERERLIRETLSGVYDKAAVNYEKNNAATLAQNEAQAKLTDTLAKVGEAVAPVITAFTNFANDALAKVQPYISDLSEKYAPMLQPALERMAEVVSEIFSYLTENWQILATLGGIIGGIAVAIGLYNAVAAVKAAMAAAEVTTVWALVAAYAAQAAAVVVAIAPYLLIVAAIAAVIAIIVLCVKHWDTIKAKVKEVWKDIKEKTTEAVNKVKEKFTELKEKISSKIEELKAAVREKFEAIKAAIQEKIQAAKNIALAIFEGITSGIKNKIETAKNIIKNVVALIKAIFTGDFGAAKTAVINIFESIVNGIKNKLNIAKNTVKKVIDNIKSFFKFEWSLPKLKLPKISISGKFSLSPPSVPKFSIAWNKLGGVFDKPTLFNYGGSLQGIGENGAEAVVPLEKNTQWLDRLATMLSAKQGNRPIVLMVDKKVLAETTVNGINDITKQTGVLPLVYG